MSEEYYDNEEYYDEEAYYDAMQDEYALQDTFDTCSTADEKIPVSMLEFQISNNYENYNELNEVMRNKQPLSLAIGIADGLPYYMANFKDYKRKIYITKEIRRQIYDYLKNGIIPDKMPDVDDVYKNMNNDFILYHLKVDRDNKANRYNPETKEYKAVYPNGTINYEELPYTPEELVSKLNSLK